MNPFYPFRAHRKLFPPKKFLFASEERCCKVKCNILCNECWEVLHFRWSFLFVIVQVIMQVNERDYSSPLYSTFVCSILYLCFVQDVTDKRRYLHLELCKRKERHLNAVQSIYTMVPTKLPICFCKFNIVEAIIKWNLCSWNRICFIYLVQIIYFGKIILK